MQRPSCFRPHLYSYIYSYEKRAVGYLYQRQPPEYDRFLQTEDIYGRSHNCLTILSLHGNPDFIYKDNAKQSFSNSETKKEHARLLTSVDEAITRLQIS